MGKDRIKRREGDRENEQNFQRYWSLAVDACGKLADRDRACRSRSGHDESVAGRYRPSGHDRTGHDDHDAELAAVQTIYAGRDDRFLPGNLLLEDAVGRADAGRPYGDSSVVEVLS